MLAANQLLVQVDAAGERPDTFILTVGHASPPAVLGTPEEQLEQLRQYDAIPVQGLVRVSLSRARLAEWVQLLVETLKRTETG